MCNIINAVLVDRKNGFSRLSVILLIVIFTNLATPFMFKQHALAHHSSEHTALKVTGVERPATKTPKFDDPYLRVLLRLVLRRLREHAHRLPPSWLLHLVMRQPLDTLWWLPSLVLTAFRQSGPVM